MNGATCETNDQCASELLRRRRLLQRRLQGACLSCNLMGREGTCWPIDADKPDRAASAATRGRRAAVRPACATASAAARSTRATRCASRPPAPARQGEHGRDLQRPRHLPGRRASRTATRSAARPARARRRATTNADCDTGIACVNNTCGLKQDGPVVHSGRRVRSTAIASTASAATRRARGACRSCALAATLGPLHADRARAPTDPRGDVHGRCAQATLRHQRQVRRQRRLPELAGRHAVRGRDAAPPTSTRPRRPATPAASAWRRI